MLTYNQMTLKEPINAKLPELSSITFVHYSDGWPLSSNKYRTSFKACVLDAKPFELNKLQVLLLKVLCSLNDEG